MNNDIDAHVGRRMRRLRWMVGVSQSHLAARLGATSVRQINDFENGKRSLSARDLHAIAQWLGVGIEYFFHGLDHSLRDSSVPQRERRGELALSTRAPSDHAPAGNTNAAPAVRQEPGKAASWAGASMSDGADC